MIYKYIPRSDINLNKPYCVFYHGIGYWRYVDKIFAEYSYQIRMNVLLYSYGFVYYSLVKLSEVPFYGYLLPVKFFEESVEE